MEQKQYKKPPLVEAVCEFRFDQGSSWDLAIPGMLFQNIEKEFPRKENVKEGVIEFFLNKQENPEPKISHSESEFPRFLSSEGNIFVLLKRNIISIHCVKPYIGWTEFKEKIVFILNKYFEVTTPNKIERIGLRYINEIVVNKDEFKLAENLDFRPYFADNLTKEEDVLGMQVGLVSKDADNFYKIQLNNLEKEGGIYAFMLDTDYFKLNASKEEVDDWLEKAHNKIEEVFKKSLKEKLIETFN